MKTIAELNALIPELISLVHSLDPQIGKSEYDTDEDGVGLNNEYASNYVVYDKNGWEIAIDFECCGKYEDGEVVNAWGRLTDLSACHYDEKTDEYSDFNDDDLGEIWKALELELEHM